MKLELKEQLIIKRIEQSNNFEWLITYIFNQLYISDALITKIKTIPSLKVQEALNNYLINQNEN